MKRFLLCKLLMLSIIFFSLPVFAETVPVTGVTLNEQSITITLGTIFELSATVAPADATNKNVKWRSSNEAVVLVSNIGWIEGRSLGTAIITAYRLGREFI